LGEPRGSTGDKDKINVIREKCIAANPKIDLLDFGCRVTFKIENVTYHALLVDRVGRDWLVSTALGVKQIPDGTLTFLGRPIRFADILLAIESTSNKTIVLDTRARMRGINEAISNGFHSAPQWNLRADDLEQQSEETINFLYELLQ
jgi:hypothetical protein